MSDFPNVQTIGPVISTESIYSWGGVMVSHTLTSPASAGWSSGNRAIYIPFALPSPFVVRSIWCHNGATAAGNIDLGVLGLDGSLIFSIGTTAQAGTNTFQIVTVTERVLAPGAYYFACVASTSSSTFFRHTYGTAARLVGGILQAASQLPLTTLPTFATTGDNVPVMGIASITSF
jgi:hypothetical protein